MSLFVVMSAVAVVLAINFRPSTITNQASREFKKSNEYRAQRGWPLRTVDHAVEDRNGPLDARGWPVAESPPPLVTHWHKLAANILILLVMFAGLWWLAIWSIDVFRAIRLATQGASLVRWALAILLCMVGVIAIISGIILTAYYSIPRVDDLLTWGLEKATESSVLKQLLLPPLFIAAGLFALAAARRWLQCDARRFKMTAISALMIVVLVVTNNMGQPLVDPFLFDMMKN